MQYFIGVDNSGYLNYCDEDTKECTRYSFDTYIEAFELASDVIKNPIRYGYAFGEMPQCIDIEVEDDEGDVVRVVPIFRDDF